MSREINNHEYRQNVIRELLADLHRGKSVEEVKKRFKEAFDGVSATEISEAENALIAGGMKVEEVQKLCDVHAAVFKEGLQDEKPKGRLPAGHPARVIEEENKALVKLLEGLKKASGPVEQKKYLEQLRGLDIHYLRKENILFPYLEKNGITAPPKVMWGVDDEIRMLIKQAYELSIKPNADRVKLEGKIEEAVSKISEMIFKEENIMLPMLFDVLSEADWKNIADQSGEIGYFLIPTPPAYSPKSSAGKGGDLLADSGSIILPTGVLSLNELNLILDTLPFDITFVDKDDTVKYFSEGAERVFPRTKAIIGRKVINCHPPASVHIVEGIVKDLKSGKKTHEDFWIEMGERLIYIRYFAVRSKTGEYVGTLEVTQNIAPIKLIEGEKRLVK